MAIPAAIASNLSVRCFVASFLAFLLPGAVTPTGASARPSTSTEAIERRVRGELKTFTDWLDENSAHGFIGEVGWPTKDRPQRVDWNAVADGWFRDADAAGLWVTTWATGEWWGTDYNLAPYEDERPSPGVDSATPQAKVVEAHRTTRRYLRGVNVAGGEFGGPGGSTDSFSNTNPGSYDHTYHYDAAETFTYLAQRGVKLVRIPFRWERLQPHLGAPLDEAELERIRRVVGRARASRLRVVLDMHNFGAYYLSDGKQGIRRPIGSSQVTSAHFNDVWLRISAAFRDNPGVIGYGLMNEPVGLPGSERVHPAQVWERASQGALSTIRRSGDRKLILVSGYAWSGVQEWSRQHPVPWITDIGDNHRYEAHHFWDRDHSGDYAEPVGTRRR